MNVSIVWPAAGIALTALLLFGYRVWPSILIGSFLANFLTGLPMQTALAIAIGNTLEALGGAFLLHRFGFQNSLNRLRDVFALLVGAVIFSTMLSASIGVSSLCISGVAQWSEYSSLWLTWWLGDALGDLLIVPLIITWVSRRRQDLQRARIAEALLLLVLVVVVMEFVFFWRWANSRPLAHLTVPFLIWAAFRFGQTGITTLSFVLSVISIWGTSMGFGPFSQQDVHQGLFLLQTFVATYASTGLVVAAVIAERREAELTARKRIELALNESEMRYRTVVQSAKDAIVLANSAGEIVSLNKGASDIFGYHEEELLLKPLTLLMPHRYREAHQKGLKRLLTTGESLFLGKTLELHGLRKDGTEFPLELSLDSWQVEAKTYYSGIIRDITERKKAEMALRESEKRYRILVDNSLGLICTHDLHGVLLSVNPAIAADLGYEQQEMTGKNLANFLDPAIRERFPEYLQAIREKQTVSGLMRLNTKDGRERVWEYQNCLYEEGNTVHYVIAYAQDVTERLQAEHKKEELIAVVSHELRTPLTVIQGSLALLARKYLGEFSVDARKLIDIGHRNSDRMMRLVNDLLDLDKIESGQVLFDLKPLEVTSVVEQAIEANEPYGTQFSVQIQLNKKAEGVKVLADTDRLMQVLTNLLSNAIKFSPKNDTVEVTVSRRQEGVAVAVTDHGPGIPDQFREHIFEKFAQAEMQTDRKKIGSGLGLTISKAIVEKMGGMIGFESVADKGTTFFFTLQELKP